MSKTRVLVADALTIFRSGVSTLLRRQSDFDVVEASSLSAVMSVLEQVGPPDIALIDSDLPHSGGIVAAEHLARHSGVQAILWSFEPSPDEVLAGIRAGAAGYLHKKISPAGLLRSLRGAVRGEAPLARDLATLMIDALHNVEERGRARERAALLSSRERQVLHLVASGGRNSQIGAELYISEFTVKRHMQNILQKLDLPTRAAAAAFYRSTFGPHQAARSTTRGDYADPAFDQIVQSLLVTGTGRGVR